MFPTPLFPLLYRKKGRCRAFTDIFCSGEKNDSMGVDKTVMTVYTVHIQNETEEPMELFIDVRSGAPIYDQIYSQIKDCILRGELAEDTALPSIRGLAKDLRISVITTKRAYDELEAEGLIYTIAGKGCFVARQNLDLMREQYRKKIEEHLIEVRKLADVCGLTGEELAEMYRLTEEDEI